MMSDNNLTTSNSAAFSFNNNSTNAFNSTHNDSLNNIYISTTNANSLNDKTKQLEKLLGCFHDKPTINVFTETCLQLPLSINDLGRKWCHGLTTAADRNGGVSLCYHPAFGDAVILNISDKKTWKQAASSEIFTSTKTSVRSGGCLHSSFTTRPCEKGIYLQEILQEINMLKITYPNLIVAGDFNTLLLLETNNMYHGFSPQSLDVKRCPGILEQWMITEDFCHPF